MKDLLQTFTIEQIILFIVILAAAVKGVVTWIDWAREKLNRKLEKEKSRDEFRKDVDEIKASIGKINSKLDNMTGSIDLLMASDKDDIKAYITREHHYFCYELGYIDDYNLDCIEKRYSHYVNEGGNSFVADLMKEIRALPKKSVAEMKQSQHNQ